MDRNYEQEYKKAFEAAKGLHDAGNALTKKQMEIVFPQLAESEDEKMMREFNDWLCEEIECRTNDLRDEKDRRTLNMLCYVLTKLKDYLEKQKEQKPAEWSEDWREEDIQTRFAFYTYKDEDGVLYLSNVFVEETSRNHGFGTRILRAAEKVAETIGATTICLKVKQDSPANAWYRKNGYGHVAFEDGYDWLEKNLEYMKPNKQEWSEEDRLHYTNVLEALEYVKGCKSDYDKIEAVKSDIAWLKLLRNRVGKDSLQPHWKPSEEQMKAFKGYIEDFQARAEAAVGGWNNFDVMIRLYEQLKKL